MSEGIAIAVKIRSTVRETANSTMLKPGKLRLRRVREPGAPLCKVVSSFKGRTSGQAHKRRLREQMMQLRCQGRPGATSTKHSTSWLDRTFYYKLRGMGRYVTN